MNTQTTVITRRQHSFKVEGPGTKQSAKVELEQEVKSSTNDSEPRLLERTELEEWQQACTESIQSGYREATPSITECVKSWCYLHNESVNIFSHLAGAVLFIVLAGPLYIQLSPRYPSCSAGDVAAFATFIFGVVTSFTCSAAFHTCACYSEKGYNIARQVDFQGIIILVLATSAPQVYYSFYTEPTLRINYWTLIGCFGVLASIVTFVPAFSKPEKHSVRVAVFAGLGLSTFAPIVHGVLLHGWRTQTFRFPLWAVGLTHSFNIMGAVVYVTHFPERWWAGKFDLIGASHQLMHCAIIGAALTLLVGTVIAFEHAHGSA